jgi:hypothetical protein
MFYKTFNTRSMQFRGWKKNSILILLNRVCVMKSDKPLLSSLADFLIHCIDLVYHWNLIFCICHFFCVKSEIIKKWHENLEFQWLSKIIWNSIFIWVLQMWILFAENNKKKTFCNPENKEILSWFVDHKFAASTKRWAHFILRL